MIHDNLLLVLMLLFVVFMLVMVGQKLKISYPIFLVLGGLLIGFIPGIPQVMINPEMVFLIFLPPLLYEAAWNTSWHDFWKWKRPISLLGFGLVIFTSSIIAYVSSSMIPGFTLALGFLLGGIISPPDAVAATSVLKNLKVPKRAMTILEGESLVNDASSLIIFRTALVVITTGVFSYQKVALDFVLVTTMGVVIGLAVAHVFYVIHRFLPTTPSIDTALTLMSPYLMYLAAEHFHYSGVMAVVSGGLFLSFRSHEILNHQSRIQAVGVWVTLTFVLNGVVFILIGLELPYIVKGLGNYTLAEAIQYGLVISVLTILIRVIWVYPLTFIPRWISKSIRTTEPSPGWKGPLLVSWSGMRGVVSLASALSIPLMLSDGQAFPQRDLILFITFVVILVTLVVQGLSLPFVIKWANIKETDQKVSHEEQEAGVQLELMKAALVHLNSQYKEHLDESELLENLKKKLESDIELSGRKLDSLMCTATEKDEVDLYNRTLLEVIKVQREKLFELHRKNAYEDEIIRKQETQLDLDESKISQRIH